MLQDKTPKRDTVLFTRIQEINKEYITAATKAGEFKSEAEYLDALLTREREDDGYEPIKKKKR